MIQYRKGFVHIFLNAARVRGSVFPQSMLMAVPCSLFAAFLRWSDEGKAWLEEESAVITNSAAWGGFSFLVGFLIVFRTSQAYARFWDGCTAAYRMRAEWFDACSALVSFCTHSSAAADDIMCFQHLLVRLVSMLHAAALAEIEENACGRDAVAYGFEIIDIASIDPDSLEIIKQSDGKVDLIFTWIQNLVVSHIKTGVLSIPPPILSRAFQEMAGGIVAFHEASKISAIPLPFPYAQTCDCILCLHGLTLPFVAAKWVQTPEWAFVFTFIQVFILWSLNFIAIEIENPFGIDSNDLNGRHLQDEMNTSLQLLVSADARRTPSLVGKPWLRRSPSEVEGARSTFRSVWKDEVKGSQEGPAQRMKSIGRFLFSGGGEIARRGASAGFMMPAPERSSGLRRLRLGSQRGSGGSAGSAGSADRNAKEPPAVLRPANHATPASPRGGLASPGRSRALESTQSTETAGDRHRHPRFAEVDDGSPRPDEGAPSCATSQPRPSGAAVAEVAERPLTDARAAMGELLSARAPCGADLPDRLLSGNARGLADVTL